MQNITFEELPRLVGELHKKLDDLEYLLITTMQRSTSSSPKVEVLSIEQAAEFLNLNKTTIYSLVSRRQIPNYKQGKRLYFFLHELTEWIIEGRKKTDKELQTDAQNYIHTTGIKKSK
ncbi:MAG: hypothetical protein BGO69_15170 [Bacteroidetes bacterium 46-16]|nr:MAG: hypothetical protein BGO69_15170 [Bacteroidetes bacterium 46-16]